jgi:hypothetical protein
MYKGKIMSKRDVLGKGLLSVCPTGSDEANTNAWISVKYQTFYLGGNYAGAVFVPETGTEITYDKCVNDPEAEWYFMGCVLHPTQDQIQTKAPVPSDKNPDLGAPLTYPQDEEDGKYNFQSMTYGISTPLGHKILMCEGRDKESDNKAVRIQSSEGRGLVLNDSSDSRRVNLHSTGDLSQLILTDSKASNSDLQTVGPEGALLRAVGNVGVQTSEGSLKLGIQDGLNIVISNSATQSHATPVLPPMFLPGLGFVWDGPIFKGSSGNVIIESDKGDISIRNHGNGVFIDCLGAQQSDGSTGASFQVRSNNKIHLYAQNGIDIKSAGDINMVGANVNIKAFDYVTGVPGKINLNSAIQDPDLDIAIRKTTAEMDSEITGSVLRFFDSNNGWDSNYVPGGNTSSKL